VTAIWLCHKQIYLCLFY